MEVQYQVDMTIGHPVIGHMLEVVVIIGRPRTMEPSVVVLTMVVIVRIVSLVVVSRTIYMLHMQTLMEDTTTTSMDMQQRLVVECITQHTGVGPQLLVANGTVAVLEASNSLSESSELLTSLNCDCEKPCCYNDSNICLAFCSSSRSFSLKIIFRTFNICIGILEKLKRPFSSFHQGGTELSLSRRCWTFEQ